ncbi:hypothetical protein KAI87_10190, partial [Myxococcota bacterium]|nr:hypothetical protein [Myxococcota bacterium]
MTFLAFLVGAVALGQVSDAALPDAITHATGSVFNAVSKIDEAILAPFEEEQEEVQEEVQEQDDEDIILILDDEDDNDASESLAESELKSCPQMPPPIFSATRLERKLSTRLLVDRSFDDSAERVMESWTRLNLGLNHRLDKSLRAVIAARARIGILASENRGAFGVDLKGGRYPAEVELREAFLEYRHQALSLRAGNQIFAWGQNELFSPADVLNPRDYQKDPLAALDSPLEIKRAIPALSGGYFGSKASVELVVLPLFERDHYVLRGEDFSLAPPGSPLEEQLALLGRVHPSVSDDVQNALMVSEKPESSPLDASIALRSRYEGRGWDLSATFYWGWDRNPRVWLDSDLKYLLLNAEQIQLDPASLVDDPDLRSASLNIEQKTMSGQALTVSDFQRMAVFALDGQMILGEFVVFADAGFSPGRIVYTETMESLSLPKVDADLGIEYMRAEELFISLGVHGSAYFNAPQDALILLSE